MSEQYYSVRTVFSGKGVGTTFSCLTWSSLAAVSLVLHRCRCRTGRCVHVRCTWVPPTHGTSPAYLTLPCCSVVPPLKGLAEAGQEIHCMPADGAQEECS